MLGGGTSSPVEKCPSSKFINELSAIGEMMEFSYPLANFTCSFFIKAKCGAPAF
jgi:hypothetical protein